MNKEIRDYCEKLLNVSLASKKRTSAKSDNDKSTLIENFQKLWGTVPLE